MRLYTPGEQVHMCACNNIHASVKFAIWIGDSVATAYKSQWMAEKMPFFFPSCGYLSRKMAVLPPKRRKNIFVVFFWWYTSCFSTGSWVFPVCSTIRRRQNGEGKWLVQMSRIAIKGFEMSSNCTTVPMFSQVISRTLRDVLRYGRHGRVEGKGERGGGGGDYWIVLVLESTT